MPDAHFLQVGSLRVAIHGTHTVCGCVHLCPPWGWLRAVYLAAVQQMKLVCDIRGEPCGDLQAQPGAGYPVCAIPAGWRCL